MISLGICYKRPYLPSQPEIQLHTDFYVEREPVKPLSEDVALFYQFKTNDKSINSLFLIPDGCFDILFCCNPMKPAAILWTSPLQRRIQPNFISGCEYFGVRFLPEQGLIKLNNPMKELLDQQIPLFDVWKTNCNLVEEISGTETFEKRMNTFVQFITRANTGDCINDQKIIKYAIKEIYMTNGGENIYKIAEKVGYTDRYLRKKFEEYIGFSPKQFSQIIRFQKSVEAIYQTPNADCLKIMVDNGYYDQTHLNKGFKKFTKLTSRQFIMNLTNG